MIAASLYWMMLALTAALPSDCPEIEIKAPISGQVLVTTADTTNGRTHRVCILTAESASRVELPTAGRLSSVLWGTTTTDLFVSFCNPDRGARNRCPIARISTSGQMIRTYPDETSPAFVEPDGRWSHWVMGEPRPSPDGKMVILSGGAHSILMQLSDGATVATLPNYICEAAWSPDGTHLAYVRGTGRYVDCVSESQVFLYDVASQVELQFTHFEPKSYRPWWNPFATSVVRPPLVSGLSWARHADVILFYIVPDRGVFLWNSRGEPLHRIDELHGECWRQTQLSADGQRIMYLSSTEGGLCLMNGGDEIRIANSDGSGDHVVIRRRDDGLAITGVDWWTD